MPKSRAPRWIRPDVVGGATDVEAQETGTDSLFQFPDALIRRLLAGEHPLKVIREARRVTIEELADRLKVSAAQLDKIEIEKQDLPEELRNALADLLHVDARALVRLVEPERNV